jgi:DNA repair exonuclease SbcCD ATPase subunit
MASSDDKLAAEFLALTRMKYVDQAKWYLNGFWTEGAEKEAETIFKFTQKFIELDDKKKAEGCELDEFQAHKFLESLGETLTVVALRERLRKIDLDCNGKMALLEYCCFKYSKGVKQIINAPQGENPEEVKAAGQKLEKVQAQLEEQRKAEESVKKAEAELRAAVEDLTKQEDSYKNAITTLENKSKDPSASTVAKSKAANELAQLKSEDPLPLRKAKITQEAALRKVEKERKKAEEETRKLEEMFNQAVEYLESVRRKGGAPLGAMWWMDRELKEAQKYLPKKKQLL